ncbi:MAG TPA: metallophosphoesterase [Ruminococcus sp.]|nr:metallophosphoesterase [Ruminococcus sp.]
MQILVLSDTHGRYDLLRKVIFEHDSADMIVHCGDGEYETERFLQEHPEFIPRVLQVRGNCDHDPAIPLSRLIPLPFGHKALALHGHQYLSDEFPENLVRLAHVNGADLVLFGHTHQRLDRYTDGVHLFNPGSTTQPRDPFSPSFGLIDILEGGILTSHGELRPSPGPFEGLFGWD